MLGALESRLTAKVADALNARDAVIVAAPLPIAAPGAGERVIRVCVDSVAAAGGFDPERGMFTGQAPALRARRVVHVAFTARVRALAQPAAAGPEAATEARRLLLEDLSLVLHALDAPPLRTGGELGAGGDPGFDVLGFALAAGTLSPELVNGAVLGELEYRGTARIWPPGVSEEGAPIRSIETVLEPQPIDLQPLQATLRAGERTTLRVKLLSRTRGAGAAAAPLRLAATVLGEVPPAERGTLAGGTAAALGGFRLYPVDNGAATVEYVAPPAGLAQARTEQVAVHLATPDGHPGLLLGSASVRIRPAVP